MVLGPHSEWQGKMAFLSGAEQREDWREPIQEDQRLSVVPEGTAYG